MVIMVTDDYNILVLHWEKHAGSIDLHAADELHNGLN